MQGLADISAFLSLQNNAIRSGAPLAVFNANVDDIKTSVEEWMDQIDVLRELQADAEAEAEESKLEKILDTLNQRIKSSIRAAQTTIVEFKRSGALEDTEADSSGRESAAESDFDSLADFGFEEAGTGTETESAEASDIEGYTEPEPEKAKGK